MNLSKEGCKRVPIWAHFYNVPLEFWTADGLSFIASSVGKPLHADSITSSFKRLNYARICIEIDIDDSLPNTLDIEMDDGSCIEIQIEYNWVPKKCSSCKEFGHLPKNCKKISAQRWIPRSSQPPLLPQPPALIPSAEVAKNVYPSTKQPPPVSAQSLPLKLSSNKFEPLLPNPNSSAIALIPECEVPSIADVPSDAGIIALGPVPQDDSSVSQLQISLPPMPPSPSSSCGLSSPSSPPASSSLLSRKLIMVDEVEKLLGRKKKVKKKCGSSGNSRGKSPKASK